MNNDEKSANKGRRDTKMEGISKEPTRAGREEQKVYFETTHNEVSLHSEAEKLRPLCVVSK